MLKYVDFIMCLLWVITEVLILVSTIKYKYPVLSPFTQLLTASLEFAVLIRIIAFDGQRLGYVTVSYIAWSVLEVLILYNVFKIEKYNGRFILLYILSIITITALMIYLVAYKRQTFFFIYFNTFMGEIIWFVSILKRKDYPIKPLIILLFFTKFVADVILIPVNFRAGTWFTSFMCVALPLLDGAFIILYFYRKEKFKGNRRPAKGSNYI